MPAPLPDPPLPRPQRKHMPRLPEARGRRGRVREHATRQRAVVRGDAGGDGGVGGVDGDGVGGAVGVGVVGDHLGEEEGGGEGGGQGSAD